MSGKTFVIAIDGPAASGKSSTAQWVARRLGFFHVDSGSLYRAATAARLEAGRDADTWTEDDVLAAAERITFVPAEQNFVPLIDGKPCDELLRGREVTQSVSRVATMPRVREWVNEHVRRSGALRNVVVDGRDIGTTVFPEADLKVFLVADPWERARRRLVQRLGHGPTDDQIADETEQIVKRDARDAVQSARATDSVLIDTTYITQEDQVDRIVALARAAMRHDGEGGDEPR
jgi:cytidylate kinase